MNTIINYPDDIDDELADVISSMFHLDVVYDEPEILSLLHEFGFDDVEIIYEEDKIIINLR